MAGLGQEQVPQALLSRHGLQAGHHRQLRVGPAGLRVGGKLGLVPRVVGVDMLVREFEQARAQLNHFGGELD